jgi:hypothetical protein
MIKNLSLQAWFSWTQSCYTVIEVQLALLIFSAKFICLHVPSAVGSLCGDFRMLQCTEKVPE